MSIDRPAFDKAQALSRLFAKYQNFLRMLAEIQLGHWLNARVGASDIIQETLLDATQDIEKFQGTSEAEFLAWLKSILLHNVNRAVDYHIGAQKRSVRREVSLERLHGMQRSSLAIEAALEGQWSSPSANLSKHELLVIVADSLAQLRDDQRLVVLLRTIEGRSFSEVASVMQRSEAACRMLWLRAIEDLKRLFAEKNLL